MALPGTKEEIKAATLRYMQAGHRVEAAADLALKELREKYGVEDPIQELFRRKREKAEEERRGRETPQKET